MGTRLRILVVDDHRDSADSLAALLQILGHDVRAAYDGAVLDLAQSFRPDVFLLDIAMPEVNGLRLAEELRKRQEHKQALLVAMTGFHDAGCEASAKAAGFDHYLVKPAGLAAIQEILESYQANNTK